MSLTDKNGVTLERGMRVVTKEGHKAHVTRLDAKSQRAVVIFDPIDGVPPVNPTMRRTNTLTVRKVAGKVLFVKETAKAAAKPAPAKPAKAKADKPAKGAAAKATGKGKAKGKPAATEAPELEPAVETITDTEEVVVEDVSALLAELPPQALEV